MKSSAVIWSSVCGFNGQLQWIPEDFTVAPTECVCGARLQVTEQASDDDSAIELTCALGHRWRDTIRLLEERLSSKGVTW